MLSSFEPLISLRDFKHVAAARGVTSGAMGVQFLGRRITAGGAESCVGRRKLPIIHKYFLHYSTFAPKDLRFEHGGRQTCFLPLAPSNLVTPLSAACVTATFLPPFKRILVLCGLLDFEFQLPLRSVAHTAQLVCSGL